jgi:hypothetical protein
MEESYIEGRFGIVMEEIRDALTGIENQLQQINKKLGSFEECIETRTPIRMLRVADMTRSPQ